ncbi:MAG TPA: beta-ketoacyl synthase N-terminal-like domain-containing protein [Saprospiraceae bacterium]|nr:beta-ketoacyl synthase N-terminal-like domain-containing protein [Saprospiraceae bacterium]HND89224.1 beta-ketoacyl synthase N-terminal-like domain-containing protein [Saprospiraceae bacterium]
MKNHQKVVISGMGVVSALGLGSAAFWESLREGRSAARPIATFDASEMPTRFWADVPATDDELTECLPQRKAGKLLTRSAKMAVLAAEEAVRQSGLNFREMPPPTRRRIGRGGRHRRV